MEDAFSTEVCVILSPLILAAVFHAITFIIKIVRSRRDPKLPQVDIFAGEIFIIATLLPTSMITCVKNMVVTWLPAFMPIIFGVKFTFLWLLTQENFYRKEKKDGYKFVDN